VKNYCYSCIVYLIASCLAFADDTNVYEWGPKAGNFQLSIRLKGGGKEIKTNQPLDLMIRFRNLSTNESLSFMLWGGDIRFARDVLT
jgi:hypothetical protein